MFLAVAPAFSRTDLMQVSMRALLDEPLDGLPLTLLSYIARILTRTKTEFDLYHQK